MFRPLVTLACNLLWKGREGFNLDYTPAFKARLRIPVICVGGFRTRAAMEAALARGLCDAVSAGRPFLADPFFYHHVRDGTPGPRCVDCNACVGHLGAQPADCYHPHVRADKDAMLAQLASRPGGQRAAGQAGWTGRGGGRGTPPAPPEIEITHQETKPWTTIDKPVELGDDDIAKLVEKKATCPFIGSAIAQGALPVRNSAADPLARLEDVRTLGNSGGGDLGDLLVLFAAGNHAFMRGSSGPLDQHVPAGLFSLAFPGSRAHTQGTAAS